MSLESGTPHEAETSVTALLLPRWVVQQAQSYGKFRQGGRDADLCMSTCVTIALLLRLYEFQVLTG